MEKPQAIIMAAAWWANLLREGTPDSSGDCFGSIMIDLARTELPSPTERQISNFQAYLEDELVKLLNKDCIWDKSNPGRGEYLRSISVDGSPDIYLMAALQKTGINFLWLPTKTRMWISPDAIKISVNGRAGGLCPECGQMTLVLEESCKKCYGRGFSEY